MNAYYSDHYVLPLPLGHRFPMRKYALLRDAVLSHLPQVRLHPAPAATDGELALVHTPDYVDAVTRGLLSPARQREIGFPWSEQMVARSRRSVGATMAAARDALSEGRAANLAGGTHHAAADRGSGYCVFNDVAVAARLMQGEWHRGHRSLLRVAIIDLDVHQGDGTASIFQQDPTVFTLSVHGARNFPFRKVNGDLDVELPDGTGDAAYLQVLHEALDRLWRVFDPGLVLYVAGADPYAGDRLGRLALTRDGLAQRDAMVLDACHARGVSVALTMAGGYADPIEDTVAIQLRTLALAASHAPAAVDGQPAME